MVHNVFVALLALGHAGRAGHPMAAAGANVRGASRLSPAARAMHGTRTVCLADEGSAKALLAALGWANRNLQILQLVGSAVSGIGIGVVALGSQLATKKELNATKYELYDALNATKYELLAAIGAPSASFAQAVAPVIFDKELVTSCRAATLTALNLPATNVPTHVTVGFNDPYVHELLRSGASGRDLGFLVTQASPSLITIQLVSRGENLRQIHRWDIDPAALTLPQQTSFRSIEAVDGQFGKWTVHLK